MIRNRSLVILAAVTALGLAGFVRSQAQDPASDSNQYTVPHPECAFYGPMHDTLVKAANGQGSKERIAQLDAMTNQVTAQLPAVPGDSRTGDSQKANPPSNNTIDRYLFQAMSAAGAVPAAPTNDYEFIRRATLDLTGRIPTPDRVTSFVADNAPDKRTKLVDELIAAPGWVDKWTMFFGDLFQNNSSNSQIRRYVPGVVAFNSYVNASLVANKPYDQMARELITAQGTNSYTQGELNFTVGGVVTGGPIQDLWDQQTVDVSQTFLGIAHMNCLLCHNGRGHLDALSLWGSQTTRSQAWGMAAFLSHTLASRTPVAGATNGLPYYWAVSDGTKYKGTYPLNTTSGNRPPRQPIGTDTSVSPAYIFNGATPNGGENYRAAMARFVTSDFQFARATVNYMFEYFFGVGLVTPSNTFDPARLDPNNPPQNCPPAAPCGLQASNPVLLNALAQDFIDSKYDLKSLMREIVNSRAYQLESQYSGTWNPNWATLYARHNVRRLWGEEIHDAIAQSSNIIPTYTNPNWGPVNWAMKLPEPLGTPDSARGKVATLLDAFLRGNRDDQTRSAEGSISQALDLMNDQFVMGRVSASGPATSLLVKSLPLPNDQLIDTLYLNVLSRYPSATEKAAGVANLGNGNRSQEAENLLWSLYNKVDFVFSY